VELTVTERVLDTDALADVVAVVLAVDPSDCEWVVVCVVLAVVLSVALAVVVRVVDIVELALDDAVDEPDDV
jgi:hypothetical protein